MKYYDDNSFDIEMISTQSYSPNIVYYTDGSYVLYYMHYDDDAEANKLFYGRYDANGNLIRN